MAAESDVIDGLVVWYVIALALMFFVGFASGCAAAYWYGGFTT